MPISFGMKNNGVCNSAVPAQYFVPPSADPDLGTEVTRTDAGRREAAHHVRTHLEVIESLADHYRPSRS